MYEGVQLHMYIRDNLSYIKTWSLGHYKHARTHALYYAYPHSSPIYNYSLTAIVAFFLRPAAAKKLVDEGITTLEGMVHVHTQLCNHAHLCQ